MDIFVARQPIFDINEKVVSYELLFRSDKNNYYNNIDGDKATIDVLNNCFTVIGMDTLTEGKKAFVNFTENLILNNIPQIFPKELIVVEILEDIEPTKEIVDACRKLKNLGYTIALDDFIYKSKYIPLIEIADIIKVDFIQTKGLERENIIKKINNKKIKFLAEKIETREEFNMAVRLGYSYFQGYFFSKPVIVSGKDISVNKFNVLELLSCLESNDLDFEKLENIIKRDVALSYKLLKLVNSPVFGFVSEITSIRHVLSILGVKKVKQYIHLIALQNISEGKNSELLQDCVIRGRFGELITQKVGLEEKSADIFLMEILINIDYFMDKPIKELLSELPVSKDIKDAILGKKNTLYKLHNLIISYQKGEWINFEIYARNFEMENINVGALYIKALKWAKDIKVT